MWVYNFITIICLVLLTTIFISVVLGIVLKKHEDRVVFVRKFKMGKCLLIYLICIPLYCLGHMYSGQDFFNSLLQSFDESLSTIVLKFNTESMEYLLNQNVLYKFTVYYCFVLIILNAVLFTVSLIGQYLWNYYSNKKFAYKNGKKIILIGNNDGNVCLYQSAKAYERIILDNISAEKRDELYYKKINYLNVPVKESIVSKAYKYVSLKSSCEYVFVINTLNDDRNISFCQQFLKLIENDKIKKGDSLYKSIKIFVYGDPKFKSIYDEIVSNSYGVIEYVNKYKQIAVDFINRYPFTQFMSEAQIDYSTSLIKSQTDINVFFIGFGKTNRQIFTTSVANNQFLTKEKSLLQLKPVNYYIFDKERAENNKNLNHNYYRFKNEISGKTNYDYLPLPEFPAKEHYFTLDINDTKFYSTIKKFISKKKSGINYIVIAFGSDLENIDMAQKLIQKRNEWGINNLLLFVKVRTDFHGEAVLREDNCFTIANEKEIVYNIDAILRDSINDMAKFRNTIYDIEYEIKHNPKESLNKEFIDECKEKSERNWYLKKSQLERESSLYCCLSLRSKLHLIGLDYCVRDDKIKSLSEKDFYDVYAKNFMPNLDYYNFDADGKRIIYYNLQKKPSKRFNLAVQEHYRWNSFMISNGIIPATINQIKNESHVDKDGNSHFTDGKNYQLRRHGCITTYDGLVTLRKLLAKRDNASEEEKDLIKYDYQLLDDAWWILNKSGFQIIKKEDK